MPVLFSRTVGGALLVSLMVLTGIASRPAAAADTDGAMAVVQTAVEGLRTALRDDGAQAAEDPERMAQLVEEHVVPKIDIPLSGQLILGRHWRDANPTERSDFVAAYRQMLLRTYSSHAMDYMDAKVEYLSVAPLGTESGRYTVRTRVERDSRRPASVDYRVSARDGEWKVFDAVINGVSLVSTMRTAVDTEVGRIGLPGLIDQLKSGKMAATPPVAETP